MAETEQLVRWACEDEYFVRAANVVHAELFLLRPYRILVDAVDVTETYAFFQTPAFTRAFADFMKEALFYAHLFPVVVFKVQKNISQWLLALGQAPSDSRDTIQLPIAVQPLTVREGQLVYHRDRRTNERYYTWTPRRADDLENWDFYCSVHLDEVMTADPVPPPTWMLERDHLAATAGNRSRRGGSDGAGPSLATLPPVMTMVSPVGVADATTDARYLLPSSFRAAFKEALDLAQYRVNMKDAESELAHPRVFMFTRPMREVLPETLSANDLLSSDRLSDASATQALRRQADMLQWLVKLVDRYRNQAEVARTDRDRSDTPQAEHRRQHGLMDVLDQAVELPDAVASVQMPQPTYNVNLAAETQRYARSMAVRFSNLPVEDVLGTDAAAVAGGGGDSSSSSSSSRLSKAFVPAEVRTKQREQAINHKRRVARDLWSTAYAVAFARHDLASLAQILLRLDEDQYSTVARELTRAVRRTRERAASEAVDGADTSGGGGGGGGGAHYDTDAPEAQETRRFNTKSARRVLTAAVRDTSELSDRAVVPTLRELRDEINERLEARSFPRSTLEFEATTEGGNGGRARASNLQEHELLPHATQEMRFHTLELVQKAAVAGITDAKSFARTAKQLFNLDIKSQELPPPEAPAPTTTKTKAKDDGASDRPTKKQRTD